MRTRLLVAMAAVFLFALTFYAPRDAEAVPGFSRQTGMACNSCHFQHFPTLNAFGRAFKAGGYTMTGGQSLVEGELLSLPSVLNASFVTKIRFQKRNGDTTAGSAGELNKGVLEFPDEAALLLGGRVGEHVGFLLEASFKDGDALFTSFKLPFAFPAPGDTKVSIVPFTTDGFGPAYGFELLNTGALRLQRTLEHRSDISAQQYIGTATSATGIALAGSSSLWFANYTLWANEHPSATGSSIASGPYLHYGRVAVTPTVAGWDLGVGAQVWAGTEKNLEAGVETRKRAEAWALDAQAQGVVGPLPVGVYLTYANAAKSKSASASEVNIFNSSTADAKRAWTVTGEVGVLPGRLTVAAAYRGGHSGAAGNDTDNATTLGAVYTPIQNVQLQLNHSWYSGEGGPSAAAGSNLSTLMLFAAF